MSALISAIENLIEEQTQQPATIQSRRGAQGGCISQAEVLTLKDGRLFFVKSNASSHPDLFLREEEGLRELKKVAAIRIPEVIGTGGGEGSQAPPFIVLEAIESGSPSTNFQREFGQKFADLHRNSTQERFGFIADNYLGSTPQPNPWMRDWVEFFREARLGFQLDLARRQGMSDATLNSLGDKLLNRLDTWLENPAEPACLLHGDLWGGNYMTDSNGQAVLIDPAAYYGRREADLAMTELFGGFGPQFYQGYEEVWPLESGSRERLDIYKLYHLLNHLNLFGGSYRSGCIEILKRFVG